MSIASALVTARRLASTGVGRELRLRASLSVRDVADCIGVDAATLSRWERGECRPRREAAVRWVEVCTSIHGALRSDIEDALTNDSPGADTPGLLENVATQQVLSREPTREERHEGIT
jgi:transcriptional regulator with XRE-family HTH domain